MAYCCIEHHIKKRTNIKTPTNHPCSLYTIRWPRVSDSAQVHRRCARQARATESGSQPRTAGAASTAGRSRDHRCSPRPPGAALDRPRPPGADAITGARQPPASRQRSEGTAMTGSLVSGEASPAESSSPVPACSAPSTATPRFLPAASLGALSPVN